MKLGDLRRFTREMRFSYDHRRVSCKTFVVVEVREEGENEVVDFVVDGHLERGWDSPWVRENSELINEAR